MQNEFPLSLIFSMRSKKFLLPLLLVICNFLVKGIFLSTNSLAGDEPFSVYHAQMNVGSIINFLSEGNNPPLYEILLHYWIRIFGITEFSVRLPSLIFSSLTVLMLYRLGVKYLNPRVAHCSSIVFIFSNYQILFAHEARCYSLLGLFTVISAYLYLGIISDYRSNQNFVNKPFSKSTINFVSLAIVNTLIIYTHYFGFFVLLTQLLFLLFDLKASFKIWKKILVYIGIIVLLFSPNILILSKRFIQASTEGTWMKAPEGIESLYNMLWSFSNAPVVAVSLVLLFAISIYKYFANYTRATSNFSNAFIVFWFSFILFSMFALSFWTPMFLDRYLMPASIAYPILIGLCADYLSEKLKFKFIIPSLVCILFVVTSRPNITNKRNVKETLAKIKEIKTNNTLVYYCSDRFTLNFIYYYNNNLFKNVIEEKNPLNTYLNTENIFPIISYNQIDTALIKKADKIIFLDAAADFDYPNNNIKEVLNSNYTLVHEYKFPEIFHIYEYDVFLK